MDAPMLTPDQIQEIMLVARGRELDRRVEGALNTPNKCPRFTYLVHLWEKCRDSGGGEVSVDSVALKAGFKAYISGLGNGYVFKEGSITNFMGKLMDSKRISTGARKYVYTYEALMGCYREYLRKKKTPRRHMSEEERLKTSEGKVLEYLRSRGLEPIKANRLVDGGKVTKCRPDMLFQSDGYYVVIEVDEQQHRYRDLAEEAERMVEIRRALRKKVIFIRFNPDEYKIKGKLLTVSEIYRYKALEAKLRSLLNIEDIDSYPSISATYMYYDSYEMNRMYTIETHPPPDAVIKETRFADLMAEYDSNPSEEIRHRIDHWLDCYKVAKNQDRNPLVVAMRMQQTDIIADILTKVYGDLLQDNDIIFELP